MNELTMGQRIAARRTLLKKQNASTSCFAPMCRWIQSDRLIPKLTAVTP